MVSFKTGILEPSEIEELLSLQRDNLLQNLAGTTASSQGFLTFQYSESSIAEMMHDMFQPVAKSDDKIVGYALATSCTVGMKNDLLKPLVELCRKLDFNGKPLVQQHFYLLGQICIREGWRGVGVFDELYKKHRELFRDKYDCVVTEIANANHRSLAAHARIGFKILHQYTENNRHWNVVAWDWS